MSIVDDVVYAIPGRNAGQRAVLAGFVRVAERRALSEAEAIETAVRLRRWHMQRLADRSARVRRARARGEADL